MLLIPCSHCQTLIPLDPTNQARSFHLMLRALFWLDQYSTRPGPKRVVMVVAGSATCSTGQCFTALLLLVIANIGRLTPVAVVGY